MSAACPSGRRGSGTVPDREPSGRGRLRSGLPRFRSHARPVGRPQSPLPAKGSSRHAAVALRFEAEARSIASLDHRTSSPSTMPAPRANRPGWPSSWWRVRASRLSSGATEPCLPGRPPVCSPRWPAPSGMPMARVSFTATSSRPTSCWREREGADHAWLTDFGIAKLARGSNLTQENVVLGTPCYMSPEQAASKSLDARADVFALGSSRRRWSRAVPSSRGARRTRFSTPSSTTRRTWAIFGSARPRLRGRGAALPGEGAGRTAGRRSTNSPRRWRALAAAGEERPEAGGPDRSFGILGVARGGRVGRRLPPGDRAAQGFRLRRKP